MEEDPPAARFGAGREVTGGSNSVEKLLLRMC